MDVVSSLSNDDSFFFMQNHLLLEFVMAVKMYHTVQG